MIFFAGLFIGGIIGSFMVIAFSDYEDDADTEDKNDGD